jgi:hypothetical protein
MLSSINNEHRRMMMNNTVVIEDNEHERDEGPNGHHLADVNA